MGLFSDKCPKCGYRIRKGARYCSACGSPSLSGYTTCGVCGAEVSLGSNYCYKCGANLAKSESPTIIGQRWIRDENDFAVRIDNVDVSGLLVKGLLIEHGTRALLFQKGKFIGELNEGKFDLGGILQRIKVFNRNFPCSVILMDAGDLNLDIEARDILTKENILVNAFLKIIIRVSNPETFYTNLFKAKKRFTISELKESLVMELRNSMEVLTTGYNINELFGNPQLRANFEAELQRDMQDIVLRVGMDIVQLRLLKFSSEAYEQIRRQRGELVIAEGEIGITEARLRLAQRLRPMLTQEKMDSFKDEKEFEDFIRQTEHELGVKDVIRQDEMQSLKERIAFNRDKEVVLRRIEIMTIENKAQRAEAMEQLLHEEEIANIRQREELGRTLESAKNEFEINKIKLEMQRLEDEHDYLEAQRAILLQEKVQNIALQKKEFEQRLERERLEAYSKATPEALMAILEGPQAERIRTLEEFRVRQHLTPEQILAMVAEKSPEAAKALAEKYRAESKISEERLKDLEARIMDQKEIADRLERMQREALTQIGAVASEKVKPRPPGSQTIVTGGVGGQPVIVKPGNAVSGRSRICPKCGISLEPQAVFCPECGHKLK